MNYNSGRDAADVAEIMDKEWDLINNRSKTPERWDRFIQLLGDFEGKKAWYYSGERSRKMFDTKDVYCKVFRDEDNLKGFIIYCKKRTGGGFIMNLGVSEKCRRKGHGLNLTKNAICDLAEKGACSVLVTPQLGNLPAIRLYEKIGFKKIGANDKEFIYEISLGKQEGRDNAAAAEKGKKRN